MSADFNPFVSDVLQNDPLLDFTAGTAFTAVKIPITSVSGQSVCDQVAVVTSNRELIRWNGADIKPTFLPLKTHAFYLS